MLDKLRDRGIKKWTAMMLPEHIELLREWHEEDNKVERPKLDDLELTLIANEIERAYKSKATIQLTYWRDGQLKVDDGVPILIDSVSKVLVMDDAFGTASCLFKEIVAVSVVEQ